MVWHANSLHNKKREEYTNKLALHLNNIHSKKKNIYKVWKRVSNYANFIEFVIYRLVNWNWDFILLIQTTPQEFIPKIFFRFIKFQFLNLERKMFARFCKNAIFPSEYFLNLFYFILFVHTFINLSGFKMRSLTSADVL